MRIQLLIFHWTGLKFVLNLQETTGSCATCIHVNSCCWIKIIDICTTLTSVGVTLNMAKWWNLAPRAKLQKFIKKVFGVELKDAARSREFKGITSRIFLKVRTQNNPSVLTDDPLEACGGVCICICSLKRRDQEPDHLGPPEALSRGGGANFECCVYKQWLNPSGSTFNGSFHVNSVSEIQDVNWEVFWILGELQWTDPIFLLTISRVQNNQ